MASVNKVILVGNLGGDPESRYLPSGTQVVSIRVATTETRGRGEDRKEETVWHSCTMFGKTAEVAAQYLKKGSQVFLEGRLAYREFESQGEKRKATEVHVDRMQMLGSRGASDGASGPSSRGKDYAEATGRSSRKPAAANSRTTAGGSDDDPPF